MPDDRYLTLHVTNHTETTDQDTLHFWFTAATESCRSLRQYFRIDETILEWNGRSSYLKVNGGGYRLGKTHLNTELKAQTSLLLHIPRGCSLTLSQVSRRFTLNYVDRQALYPATISLADEIPPACRNQQHYIQLELSE